MPCCVAVLCRIHYVRLLNKRSAYANSFLAINRALLRIRHLCFLSAVARKKLSRCKPISRNGPQYFSLCRDAYWPSLSPVLRLVGCLVGSHGHLRYWSRSLIARVFYRASCRVSRPQRGRLYWLACLRIFHVQLCTVRNLTPLSNRTAQKRVAP